MTALRAPARFAISGADNIVRAISRAAFARRLREGCEARLDWRARRATRTRRQLYREGGFDALCRRCGALRTGRRAVAGAGGGAAA